MTKQQLHRFACFIREYIDLQIPFNIIEQRHGFNPEKLNFRQAVDTYARHHKLELEPKIKNRKNNN